MPALLELAPTGRARCRGCQQPIAKGERRVGDRFASPFADDSETTHWYHPLCAAYKWPEVLLAALELGIAAAPDDAALATAAQAGVAHRRLPRIDGAERASSGRAACRACREPIAAHSWRIRLAIFDTGRYQPAGFVHARCAAAYFELPAADRGELLARVRHFTPDLTAPDTAELSSDLVGE